MILGRLLSLILWLLPQHGISRFIHRLARWRFRPWKNALIRGFSRLYQVDTGEAVNSDPASYEHFNAFFTRALQPGMRPLDNTPGAIISPVDGAISQIGAITDGEVVQAKRRRFSVRDLLGGDPRIAERFGAGHFATLYLSPKDYHRIHMPCDGQLERMIHVPGRLLGVSDPLVRHVRSLFARNERVVTLFEGPRGPMAMVLVGAIGVGSIETVWSGEVTPPRGQRIRQWDYRRRRIPLSTGEEMGRFNLGSTVILLFGEQAGVRWSEERTAGTPIRLGERLGGFEPPSPERSGLIPGESHHRGQ